MRFETKEEAMEELNNIYDAITIVAPKNMWEVRKNSGGFFVHVKFKNAKMYHCAMEFYVKKLCWFNKREIYGIRVVFGAKLRGEIYGKALRSVIPDFASRIFINTTSVELSEVLNEHCEISISEIEQNFATSIERCEAEIGRLLLYNCDSNYPEHKDFIQLNTLLDERPEDISFAQNLEL